MSSFKGLCEIFGYSPDDPSKVARNYWDSGQCPFLKKTCTKVDHQNNIVGACSATVQSNKDVIICPNRLYANNYDILVRIAKEVYGDGKLFLYDEYLKEKKRGIKGEVTIALGQNSGREVSIPALSMDWVLARANNKGLKEYCGVEVQSIDITGNYRDNWTFYKKQKYLNGMAPPNGKHGFNWANVHKRLIPQIIKKGTLYSRSEFVKRGLFFIVPQKVYVFFERTLGHVPETKRLSPTTLTVQTYELGPTVSHGKIRDIVFVSQKMFELDAFIKSFVAGTTLPPASDLDKSVASQL